MAATWTSRSSRVALRIWWRPTIEQRSPFRPTRSHGSAEPALDLLHPRVAATRRRAVRTAHATPAEPRGDRPRPGRDGDHAHPPTGDDVVSRFPDRAVHRHRRRGERPARDPFDAEGST